MKKYFFYIYSAFLLLFLSSFFYKTIATPTAKKPPFSTTSIHRIDSLITESVALTVGAIQLKTNELREAIEQVSLDDTLVGKAALNQVILNKRLLQEAIQKGYRDAAYEEELQAYHELVADAYLTDSTTIKHLLKETYSWMKQEVKAAHIMYDLPEFAAPKDTTEIYLKLLQIRDKALAEGRLPGEDFGKLAQTFSQDKFTNLLGGNLGWFTALKLEYPLEKVAFEMPIGQISMPIRSKNGYHLVKVLAKRPYSGEVQVGHLMKILLPNSPDSLKVKAEIDSLYFALKTGANFDELCQKYSDDRRSKNSGGLLPKFSVGKREENFENAAFALKEGEFSAPVRTSAGWHILKLVKKFSLESYEKLLPKLQEKVTTDSRGELVKENTSKQLKRINNFSENKIIANLAMQSAEKLPYSPADTLLGKTIFTLNNQPYKVKSFLDFAVSHQPTKNKLTNIAPKISSASLYKNFVTTSVKNYSSANLENQNTEFKNLMDEYRNDLLTTRLMNERVFEKSVSDTTGQRNYYNQHIAEYAVPERVFATIIATTDVKFLQQIKEILAKGTPYQLKRGIQPINYDKFAVDLTSEHKKRLLGLLAIMRKQPDYVVEIGGNADESENDSTSTMRLKKLRDFLVTNGLPITRIIENDFQKTKPESETDWTQNARVSFQFFSNAKEDLEKTLNIKKADAVSIKEGYFRKGDNAVLDGMAWEKGVKQFDKNGKIVEVTIDRIEPARNKTIREARGEVIKGYQAILEQQFKAELAMKYPVKLNEVEIRKIVK